MYHSLQCGIDNLTAFQPGLPEVGGVDQAMSLSISFANPNWEINGTPFVPPSVPVLLQILSGTTDPTALLPAGSVIGLQPNKTYEINFDIEAASNVRTSHSFWDYAYY